MEDRKKCFTANVNITGERVLWHLGFVFKGRNMKYCRTTEHSPTCARARTHTHTHTHTHTRAWMHTCILLLCSDILLNSFLHDWAPENRELCRRSDMIQEQSPLLHPLLAIFGRNKTQIMKTFHFGSKYEPK